MRMNLQCELGQCVHQIVGGVHFSVAPGQNCLHQNRGKCISRNVDKRICFNFFLHIYLHIIYAQVPRLGDYYIKLNTCTCDDDW